MTAAILLVLATQSATLSGTVRVDPSGEPIAGAVIEVTQLDRSALSNESGDFVLAGLPPGSWNVRISALGYSTFETRIEVGTEAVRIDAHLSVAAVELDPVTVEAQARTLDSSMALGVQTFDSVTIQSIPGLVEADVFRAAQHAPSTGTTSDYSSALYVRGGSPDQTLVLLDGMPLFNPYHLGGLVSAIDPEAIAMTRLWPGAVPASQADRLSGTFQIFTRDGGRDRLRGSGAVSLSSARLSFDGPLPGENGSFLVSARRSYWDVVTDAAAKVGIIEDELPYSFSDFHAKLTQDIGQSGQVELALYRTNEEFRLPSAWEVGESTWKWGSLAFGATYSAALLPRLHFTGRIARSGFDGLLGAGPSSEDPIGGVKMVNDLAEVQLEHFSDNVITRGGLQWNHYTLAHEISDHGPGRLNDFLPPFSYASDPSTTSAYLEQEWRVAEWNFRPGLRALYVEDEVYWMPRLSIDWLLAQDIAISAGAGSYVQRLHTLRNEEAGAAAIFAYDLLVAGDSSTPVESAFDAVIGVEWRPAQFWLRANVFGKWYTSLALPPFAKDPASAPAIVVSDFTDGTGEAIGLELSTGFRDKIHHLSVSYSLQNVEYEREGLQYNPRYSRRHWLDIFGAYKFTNGWELGGRTLLGSGQPYTPVIGFLTSYALDPATGELDLAGRFGVYGKQNSAALPPYFRLDISVEKTFSTTWFGRSMSLTPRFQIINAFATKNVFWREPDERGRGVIETSSQMPWLPSIGFGWTF